MGIILDIHKFLSGHYKTRHLLGALAVLVTLSISPSSYNNKSQIRSEIFSFLPTSNRNGRDG
jgi:hypothetical protein